MNMQFDRHYAIARRIATIAAVSVSNDGGMSIGEVRLRPDDDEGGSVIFADWGFGTPESIREQAVALLAGVIAERTFSLGVDFSMGLREHEQVFKLVSDYVDAAYGPVASPQERSDLIDEELLYCYADADDAIALNGREIRIVTKALLQRRKLGQGDMVCLVRG